MAGRGTTRMAKYKVAVGLLCGRGFTSLLLLLIRLTSPSPIALFPLFLLLRGGAIAHVIVRSQDIGPPLLVLAANEVVYAAVA
jgi:hypothetical protein